MTRGWDLQSQFVGGTSCPATAPAADFKMGYCPFFL